MKVYSIILNYNTFEETISLVQQLQSQKSVDLHVVVVDNCSRNESFEKIKDATKQFSNVEVLQSERNGGYSYGNNYGLNYIKKYDPEFVLILNNDILLNNKYLIHNLLEEYMKYDNAYLCAPSMYIDNKESNSAWRIPTYTDLLIMATRTGKLMFKPANQYSFAEEKTTEPVECVAGSFFLCDYAKFEKLGFFDEDIFLFGEETILAQKIKDQGGVNLLCRQLHYDHLWSKSINPEVNKIKRVKLQLYGREVFLRKYTNVSRGKISILKALHALRILEERTRLFILKTIYK